LPRAKRITFQDHYHLIVAKSSSDSQLFYDDIDFEAYLETLRQIVRDKFCVLYAFCLQKKEIRLAIKPYHLSLARIMQRLHCSHTLRINKRYLRKGNLFQGRFKSIIFSIEDLLNVVRSIHLWPIRTGVSRRVESYYYSSQNTYSLGTPWSDLINTREVLSSLSDNLPISQKTFVRFVESAALEKDDYGIQERIPGVSETGIELLKRHTKNENNLQIKKRLTLPHIAKRVGLLLNVNPTLLLTASRRQDLVMARRLLATAAVMNGRKSITEVASYLNRDKAQISRLVSQGMDLVSANEPFKTLLDSLKGKQVSLSLSKTHTDCAPN